MKRIFSFFLVVVFFVGIFSFSAANTYAAKAEKASINCFIEDGIKLIRENDANKEFVPEETETETQTKNETEHNSFNRGVTKISANEDEAGSEEVLSDTAFQTCRLLVKATKTPDRLNSIGMASGFKDWYIVQFKNEKDTKTAYEYYINQEYVTKTTLDKVFKVDCNEIENDDSAVIKTSGTCLNSKGSVYTGLYDTKKYISDNVNSKKEYVVGVVDSGVYLTNEFLSGRIKRTYFNACSDGDESSEHDAFMHHGTKVGSIIVDNTPDNVKLSFYRVLDKKGNSTTALITLGIIAAVNDGVNVINCSLGIWDESGILNDAVNNANEEMIAVIAAAGNNHMHINTRPARFPACIKNVITVGSSNEEGFYPSLFTNYGESVDLLAPGEHVPVSYGENIVDISSGTSFSTPYVVSLFLQIKTLFPNLSNKEIERRMYSTSHKTDLLSDCELYGYGIIDAIGALGLERSNVPSFSLTPGSYVGMQTISIVSDSQTEIYYTLDQTFPSKENGICYTEPIEIIDDNYIIKAVAYSDCGFRSEVISELYKVFSLGNENEFEITDEGEIITYTGSENNLRIPEMINGIPVKSFSGGVFSNSRFSGISLPNSIQTVSEETFIGNENIQMFEGKGVKTIEENAFDSCSALMQVTIPDVEIIRGWSFNNCCSLSQIEAPLCTKIETEAFYNCKRLRKASLPRLSFLGFQAFTYCTMLAVFYAPKLKDLEEDYSNGRQFTGDELFRGLDLPELENLPANFISYSNYDGFRLNEKSYVSRLELSRVKYIYNLPVGLAIQLGMPVIVALPSTLEYCSEEEDVNELLNHTPNDLLTFFGSCGTYAEQWANENGFEFIEVTPESAVLNDLPDEFYDYMRYLYADVVGFNRTYQWYGSYLNKNTGGIPIAGATERRFVPKDNEQYPYYYCVVTSTDVGYDPIEIRTGSSRYMGFNGEMSNADYSSLDEILATVPEDLSIYTDESAAALNEIINNIDRNLDVSNQATVDGYVEAISNALLALKLKEHMVSFIVDNKPILSYELEYGSEITDIPPNPDKTGYAFSKWTPDIPSAMPNNPITFTAEFEPVTYYASFMVDDKEIEKVPFTVESESISEPKIPDKEGYTGKWTEYIIAASDITVNAEYTINEYTVSFVADDKTVKSVTVEYGFAIEIPDNPQKAGYIFKKWLPEIPETMPAKDMSFYAVFEEIQKPVLIPSVSIKNYVSVRTVDYKTTIIFTAVTDNMPEGTSVVWYKDGEEVAAGEKLTVKEATEAFILQVKIVDESGSILSSSETELVKVKTGLFSKLIAFFRILFGKLPIIEQ